MATPHSHKRSEPSPPEPPDNGHRSAPLTKQPVQTARGKHSDLSSLREHRGSGRDEKITSRSLTPLLATRQRTDGRTSRPALLLAFPNSIPEQRSRTAFLNSIPKRRS
jgi:hypothetical protein